MYKAISYFKDMKDNMHPYNPGDTFPRDGLKVDAKRLEELSTDKNRRGKPVIELVKEKKKAEEKPEVKEEPIEEAIVEEPIVEEPKPKKRGRKKNAD
jgi:CO dehydrogenase/acetyl-CoA synthase beta subunit